MNKYSDLSSAIAWTKKKMQIYDGQEKRWLDHNSEIQLSLKQLTSQNAEFYVNDSPNHTIWYSQLTEIFIQTEDLSLCTGDTITKNGNTIHTFDMDLDTFIKFIKDKTFRVYVNSDGPVAKFDRKTIPPHTSYADAQKLVSELVQKGEYEEAAKYLLPSTEYTIVEI